MLFTIIDDVNLHVCYFCRSDRSFLRLLKSMNTIAVYCMNCGCKGPRAMHQEEAIEVWNALGADMLDSITGAEFKKEVTKLSHDVYHLSKNSIVGKIESFVLRAYNMGWRHGAYHQSGLNAERELGNPPTPKPINTNEEAKEPELNSNVKSNSDVDIDSEEKLEEYSQFLNYLEQMHQGKPYLVNCGCGAKAAIQEVNFRPAESIRKVYLIGCTNVEYCGEAFTALSEKEAIYRWHIPARGRDTQSAFDMWMLEQVKKKDVMSISRTGYFLAKSAFYAGVKVDPDVPATDLDYLLQESVFETSISTLQEACKEICYYCRAGTKVEITSGGTYHRDSKGSLEHCRAIPIRVMIDKLKKEREEKHNAKQPENG
jgi:hypothetical protein